MKLKQIKEFNETTITPEIASKIGSIAAWNHLNEERFAGLCVVKNAETKGVAKTGGGSCYPYDPTRADLYDEVPTGVEITIKATHQRIRVWETGTLMCCCTHNDESEYEYITRNRKTGEERESIRIWHPNHQIELLQLYLDEGFYTIEQ